LYTEKDRKVLAYPAIGNGNHMPIRPDPRERKMRRKITKSNSNRISKPCQTSERHQSFSYLAFSLSLENECKSVSFVTHILGAKVPIYDKY